MSRFFLASILACAFLATGAGADEPKGLREALERGDFPKTSAVIVIRAGKPIYEGYFGDGGAAVLHNTRSATKSGTSLAVGLAIADGRIASVREPAFAMVKDLAPFKKDPPEREATPIEVM